MASKNEEAWRICGSQCRRMPSAHTGRTPGPEGPKWSLTASADSPCLEMRQGNWPNEFFHHAAQTDSGLDAPRASVRGRARSIAALASRPRRRRNPLHSIRNYQGSRARDDAHASANEIDSTLACIRCSAAQRMRRADGADGDGRPDRLAEPPACSAKCLTRSKRLLAPDRPAGHQRAGAAGRQGQTMIQRAGCRADRRSTARLTAATQTEAAVCACESLDSRSASREIHGSVRRRPNCTRPKASACAYHTPVQTEV